MRRASCAARLPPASSCLRSVVGSARFPDRPQVAARSNFPDDRRDAAMTMPRSLATAGALVFLSAWGHTLVSGGPHTIPGPGPGGRPMTTVTEQAVGMPPVPRTIVYPVTARIQTSDNYFGTRVED